MEISKSNTTITATNCGQYNQTIKFSRGTDNLWRIQRREGATRPGWTESKVYAYLNHCYS